MVVVVVTIDFIVRDIVFVFVVVVHVVSFAIAFNLVVIVAVVVIADVVTVFVVGVSLDQARPWSTSSSFCPSPIKHSSAAYISSDPGPNHRAIKRLLKRV